MDSRYFNNKDLTAIVSAIVQLVTLTASISLTTKTKEKHNKTTQKITCESP